MISKIVICTNLDYAREIVLSQINSKLIKHFFTDDFNIEDAHAVTKEAYIAENESKYIIISANTFNQFAQNSLLKLFEEPPKNIIFIIIVKSKSILLPTIRSRLPIEYIKIKNEKIVLDIDLKSMSYQDIFEFLKNNKFMKKEELKKVVQEILHQAITELKIDFLESELEMFDKLLILSEQNSRSSTILSYLLLLIYRKKSDRVTKQRK